MPKTPEGYIQGVIMDWLAAEHILAFRQNTGVANFAGRKVAFGVKGMADILAFKNTGVDPYGAWCDFVYIEPIWIECKAPNGKQSAFQKSFQQMVEEHGHRYIIARSLDDVQGALGRSAR